MKTYCMSPEKLNPKIVAEKIALILEESKKIRSELEDSIPIVEKKAIQLGKFFRISQNKFATK